MSTEWVILRKRVIIFCMNLGSLVLLFLFQQFNNINIYIALDIVLLSREFRGMYTYKKDIYLYPVLRIGTMGL